MLEMRHKSGMRILGIETSCDETAVCLIEASGEFPGRAGGADFSFRVLGNALLSQAALHSPYGGVFPNLAKREHAKNLVPLLDDALRQAGELKATDMIYHVNDSLLEREPELLEQLKIFATQYGKPDVDAIAVTHGPGLEPALWVGINFAKALSELWGVPIVAVDHMEGHVVLPMMEVGPPSSGKLRQFEFPMLALLISGGHTELIFSKEWQQYERIGETRDDAAGEAFDKVARLLGLPYPGGPEISRLASQAREKGVEADFTFTRPMLREDNFDFSFSGLKTAVRNLVDSKGRTLKNSQRSDLEEFKMRVAREFEDTVADVLVEKTRRAADEYGANTIVVGGGVSANARIRERIASTCQGDALTLLVPPIELATDNAIMIALAGYFHALNREFVNPDLLAAHGNLRLENKE